MPAMISPIGFAAIAAFQTHCAAAAKPIFPVRTPTITSLAVSPAVWSASAVMAPSTDSLYNATCSAAV